MKEKFEDRRVAGSITLTLSNGEKWTKDKTSLCEEILDIVETYTKQNYTLTLRQLYYQLVAADAIRNDDVVYKKLSGVLDDLRYSGLLDWDAIEDRGRVPYLPYYCENLKDGLNDLLVSFRLDRQNLQRNLVEVWTEKDAISGILKRVTSKYMTRLVVNKGYSSSTAMYSAYKRFYNHLQESDTHMVTILYFGDHDPSGLDMLRDIKHRLSFFLANSDLEPTHPSFTGYDEDGNALGFWVFWLRYIGEKFNHVNTLVQEGLIQKVVVERIRQEKGTNADFKAFVSGVLQHYWCTRLIVEPLGLTMQQIQRYNPPHNPAKITDPRADWYIAQHGKVSWEVDALSPQIMEAIVDKGIRSYINEDLYKQAIEGEMQAKAQLESFIESIA